MADDACDLCAEFPASYLWEWVGTLPGLPGWPIRLCARCCAEWRGWTAEDADPLPYRVRSCAEAAERG